MIRTHQQENPCLYRKLLLVSAYLSFLFLGMYFASVIDTTLSSMMRSILIRPVSIIGMITVLLIPLLLSFVVISLRVTELLYVLSACKGFLLGFCLYGSVLAFHSAGWLLGSLLMFSDSCMTFFLFLIWFYCLGEKLCVQKYVWFAGITVAVLIGWTDYCCVRPLLQRLTAGT